MAIFGTGLDLGLAILLASVFVKYVGIKLDGRPLNFLVSGAVVFLFGGVLSGVNLGLTIPAGVNTVLDVIGTLAVLLGALLAVYKLVVSTK